MHAEVDLGHIREAVIVSVRNNRPDLAAEVKARAV